VELSVIGVLMASDAMGRDDVSDWAEYMANKKYKSASFPFLECGLYLAECLLLPTVQLYHLGSKVSVKIRQQRVSGKVKILFLTLEHNCMEPEVDPIYVLSNVIE